MNKVNKNEITIATKINTIKGRNTVSKKAINNATKSLMFIFCSPTNILLYVRLQYFQQEAFHSYKYP